MVERRWQLDPPETLAQAMTIGWTQNSVILEAELTFRERAWYIRVVQQFRWSKLELQRKIAAGAHREIALDFTDWMCYTEEKNSVIERSANAENPFYLPWQYRDRISESIDTSGFAGLILRFGTGLTHRI